MGFATTPHPETRRCEYSTTKHLSIGGAPQVCAAATDIRRQGERREMAELSSDNNALSASEVQMPTITPGNPAWWREALPSHWEENELLTRRCRATGST